MESVDNYDWSTDSEEMLTETTEVPIEKENETLLIIRELHNLSFKMRAFMESSEGDYGLGVETGMQRAADMIDNLISRHKG